MGIPGADPDPHHPAGPPLPSVDPFHRPPRGFAKTQPGAILRTRRVELALFGLVPQRVSAWQLLYRSCDLHGAPEAAITTVLLPDDADPEVERPLLAFQTAMDAVSERCAPSYALRRGARAIGSVTQFEWLLVANALRRGWAVSIADHEGPHGNFGAPREPGYRVLDGLRAAIAFAPLGLRADTPIGVWGYSGGGMASSWVAEMAPSYAPELNIVGAVLGAPVGDPGQVFERLNGTSFAGLPAIVIAALHRLYPALGAVILDELSPEGREFIERAEKASPLEAILSLAGKHVDDFMTGRRIAEIMATPEFRAMFDDLRLGHAAPTCPLLVVQPIHDQVIHMDGVDGQVARYRAGGARVTYVRDRLSEHFSMLVLATPISLTWLADRLEGAATDTADDDVTVWSVLASRRGLRGLLEMATTTAKVILGRPLRQEHAPQPPLAHEQAA
ncbi:lipase [Nocardia sp. NEAU-351]|uniref:Lipase n=1 Tax=Nocardia bovistercoris TaxID=2785916 RepID=A0A931N5I5_9NOCA|nr:lipase [Nocardia bovistercoris]